VICVLSSLWIVAALTIAYFRKLPAVFACAGVAMLLAIHLRTDGYFMQARPDMEALALALLALILMHRGFERERFALYALGVLTLCIAYLFKQTSAIFALVPFVRFLLRRDGFTIGELIMVAAAPLAIVLLIVRHQSRRAGRALLHDRSRRALAHPVSAIGVCRGRVPRFMPLIPVALCLASSRDPPCRSQMRG